MTESSRITLGLGANLASRWGTPLETFIRAKEELAQRGVHIISTSHLYSTAPKGPGHQGRYLNAVLLGQTRLAPGVLLRLVKRIEREAGRRLGYRWGPRCLDIDILDYGGRRIGWPARQSERGQLQLPHPLIHERAFVLVPLLDVVPAWSHPVLGISGRRLLARLAPKSAIDVRQALDSTRLACDKVTA